MRLASKLKAINEKLAGAGFSGELTIETRRAGAAGYEFRVWLKTFDGDPGGPICPWGRAYTASACLDGFDAAFSRVFLAGVGE